MMLSFRKFIVEYDVKMPAKSASKGIDRKDMPQIDPKDMNEFMKFSRKEGCAFERCSLDPNKLRPTQHQFHKEKIRKIMKYIEDGEYDNAPILVSKDHRIMDGHHRWLAHKNMGVDIKVNQAKYSATELMGLMRRFPKSYTKKLYEEVLVEDCELVGMEQIRKFELFVDRIFKAYDIDFNFTRHFADRMSDERNRPCIKMKELADFIKKIYKRQGKSLKDIKDAEAVIKDMQSDLNIPVSVEYDSKTDEFDVAMKTIMRKKNFKTPNKIIRY